jgi:hypothetical protein
MFDAGTSVFSILCCDVSRGDGASRMLTLLPHIPNLRRGSRA